MCSPCWCSPNCINMRPSFGGGQVATMHLPTAIIDIINTNIDYVRRTARLPADFSLEQLDLLRMVALFGGPDTHIQFNTTLYPAQPLDQHYCDCVDRARATLVTNTIGSLQGELYSYLGRDHVMAVGLELANRDVIEIDYDPYVFPTFSVAIEGIVKLHGINQTHPDSGRPVDLIWCNSFLCLSTPVDAASTAIRPWGVLRPGPLIDCGYVL